VATSDDTLSESPEVLEPAAELSFRLRFGLCAAAWTIAMIATVGFSLEMLFWAWLFPVGLFGLFAPASWEPPGGPMILVPGWALYLCWSVYLLTQRRRSRFFVAYAFLLVFLLFNVVGCHVQRNQPFKFGC
jgi:hypothetical protein